MTATTSTATATIETPVRGPATEDDNLFADIRRAEKSVRAVAERDDARGALARILLSMSRGNRADVSDIEAAGFVR